MARTSSVYYIAPSAISIVPNCNGTASDMAVSISRGTKIKVYYPDIADLDTSPTTKAYLEWTMRGRNRRLTESEKPYTIYARLNKSDHTDGYLVFAAQEKNEDSGEWEDPYILSPNTSSSDRSHSTDRRGNQHTWQPIPARQAQDGRSGYWWVKLGTVSVPEGDGRTVELDTGILGTEQYNAQWRLNPDDLPDRAVSTSTVDRGAWNDMPQVTYKGPTGQRTPDGTLDAAVAAALGWQGTEPLTFTNGEPVDEPYRREGLSRSRFIASRLASENDALTDADLYKKLTNATKGWEEENKLETSRVWHYGILWECLIDGTMLEPCWDSTDWLAVGGDTVYYCELTSSAGTTFRNGNVDTILTMEVSFGQEVITDRLTAQAGASVVWGRCTRWNPATRRFEPTSEDEAWAASPVPDEPYSIYLRRSDMGSGWMVDYRQALIHCSVYADDEDGITQEYPADFITSI